MLCFMNEQSKERGREREGASEGDTPIVHVCRYLHLPVCMRTATHADTDAYAYKHSMFHSLGSSHVSCLQILSCRSDDDQISEAVSKNTLYV
jgi:hypothetical protein